jgi:hypothetical protein
MAHKAALNKSAFSELSPLKNEIVAEIKRNNALNSKM